MAGDVLKEKNISIVFIIIQKKEYAQRDIIYRGKEYRKKNDKEKRKLKNF